MLVLLQPECKRDIAVLRHDRPAIHWTGDSMKLLDWVLEPGERISEILFGLIMALTVTGTTSVVTADRFQIRTMLIAALGCNVAWGIIDAGMYLMARQSSEAAMPCCCGKFVRRPTTKPLVASLQTLSRHCSQQSFSRRSWN
jgi:hypothetical protein